MTGEDKIKLFMDILRYNLQHVKERFDESNVIKEWHEGRVAAVEVILGLAEHIFAT